MQLSWYEYRQNNSGGYLKGPAHVIYIQAPSSRIADAIAEEKYDIYFDGVHDERDCSCCGDRWSNGYRIADKDVPDITPEAIRHQMLTSKWGNFDKGSCAPPRMGRKEWIAEAIVYTHMGEESIIRWPEDPHA